jgi:glucose-6-phosphate 1-epimerase
MSTTPITITHSNSGAVAQVHPFGATVISYITSHGKELLFLSRNAKLDGSKAIRGGIPLVFPQFGQPDPSMPQHGFLRTNLWQVDTSESSKFDNAEAAGISLVLPLNKAIHSRGGTTWDKKDTELDCIVTLSINVTALSLRTTLSIENTGNKPFDFSTLMHTYYNVENALDPTTCNVTGLEGYTVYDQITKESHVLGNNNNHEHPIVIVDGNVDRIYTPPPGADEKMELSVVIQTGRDKKVQLTASGQVDGQPVPVSAVVWNPHEKKAKDMSDFANDEYVNMICVEPGLLTHIPAVHNKVEFTQTLIAMDM